MENYLETAKKLEATRENNEKLKAEIIDLEKAVAEKKLADKKPVKKPKKDSPKENK